MSRSSVLVGGAVVRPLPIQDTSHLLTWSKSVHTLHTSTPPPKKKVHTKSQKKRSLKGTFVAAALSQQATVKVARVMSLSGSAAVQGRG